MKRIRKAVPLMWAAGVICVVLGMVSGVTFAALQSQNVKLTGNSIQSATANLQIGTAAGSFSGSTAGFTFPNVEPGGSAVPTTGSTFYVENSGSTNLALRMSIDQFDNPSNVNLSKVFIVLTPVGGVGIPQTLSLAALINANSTGGVDLGLSQASGSVGQYRLQVSMAADAIGGGPSSGATIGGIEFIFGGVTTTS